MAELSIFDCNTSLALCNTKTKFAISTLENADSPDLHLTKHCFRRLKEFLNNCEVYRSSKAAKKYTKWVWQEDGKFNAYVRRVSSTTSFIMKVLNCLAHGENNNWTG